MNHIHTVRLDSPTESRSFHVEHHGFKLHIQYTNDHAVITIESHDSRQRLETFRSANTVVIIDQVRS